MKRLKIEKAIEAYREGTKQHRQSRCAAAASPPLTIRECAELCRVDYRDFLNELAKRGLIGGNAKLQQIMLKGTSEQLGTLSSQQH